MLHSVIRLAIMMKFLFAILAFLALKASAENYATCKVNQTTCYPASCQTPNCACSGDEPAVPLKQRPQIVYLTFDDAMTALFDVDFYEELFMSGKYTNPNGCPIKATFFVTARSNDYHVTHKYWRHGHEIAAHSITHRGNTTYWRTLSPKGWADEMVGVREMVSKFARIPADDVIGVRAPYLQGGGDEMFDMLKSNGFKYDCSAPSLTFGYENMDYGRWPYTLDYYNDMDCQIEPCPRCASSGIWSQPMLDLEDNRIGQNPANPTMGYPCAMADTCQIPDNSADSVFEMFKRNFERAYNGNTRAPFGVYLHTSWFVSQDNAWHYEGYKKFIEYVLEKPDVWIVPIRDGIAYTQNGTLTNADLTDNAFEPFNCSPDPEPLNCKNTFCTFKGVVNEDFNGEEIRMATCELSCPRNFPWLGNPRGD